MQVIMGLEQFWHKFEGHELPVAFHSKSLNQVQRKWTPYEKETYALLCGLRNFKHYLTGRKFYAVTDCRALAHLNTTKEISPKVMRWLNELQVYDIVLTH